MDPGWFSALKTDRVAVSCHHLVDAVASQNVVVKFSYFVRVGAKKE